MNPTDTNQSPPSDADIESWLTELANATRLGKAKEFWVFDVCASDVSDIIRAALARWGYHSVAPIPATDRLPEECDCDEVGSCWQWENADPIASWKLLHRDWLTDPNGDSTHWLPIDCLPCPFTC